MGFLKDTFFPPRQADSLENPSTNLVLALSEMEDGGPPSASGIRVTAKNALRHVTVYACIRILSETIASLPVPIYVVDGRGRVKDREDWRWDLLNIEPNPDGSAMELWEHLIGSANIAGRGYAYIERLSMADAMRQGREYNLWPISSSLVERKVDQKTKRLTYQVRDPATGKDQAVDPLNMFEISTFSGIPPIDTARQAIASALAADEYAGRLWANDGRPGGVITAEGNMDDEQFKKFRQRWEQGHRGLSRSHLVGVLTGGAKWQDVGMTPEAAQFLATRKFSVNEMARLFRVPPYMVGDTEPGAVSYASVEQQAIDFVVHSLRPWLVRMEQELKRKIFNTGRDRAAQRYARFQVDGLLRGDQRSRYLAYSVGIQWGFLSRADVRELEDMPEIPGLDTYAEPGRAAQPAVQQPKQDEEQEQDQEQEQEAAARRLLLPPGPIDRP